MGAGIITVVGLLVMAVVLSVFPEFSPVFKMLPVEEQNLTRAGHGFALAVAMVAGFWWLPAARAQLGDIQSVIDNPRDHWPVIAGVFLFGYGLYRFIVGARQCWGWPNASLAGRSFFTMSAGVVGAWFVWPHINAPLLPDDVWVALGWLALFMVCCWSILTGSMRFALLAVGGSRRGAPAVVAAASGFWGFCRGFFKIVDKTVYVGMVLFLAGSVLLFVGYLVVTPHSFEEIFLDAPPLAVPASPPAPGDTPKGGIRKQKAGVGTDATASPVPRALLINPYPKRH